MHPLRKYVDLCLWAGLPTATMTVMDCYLAGGQIISQLSARCREFKMKPQQLVESMTPAELHNLRAAIKWRESLNTSKSR